MAPCCCLLGAKPARQLLQHCCCQLLVTQAVLGPDHRHRHKRLREQVCMGGGQSVTVWLAGAKAPTVVIHCRARIHWHRVRGVLWVLRVIGVLWVLIALTAMGPGMHGGVEAGLPNNNTCHLVDTVHTDLLTQAPDFQHQGEDGHVNAAGTSSMCAWNLSRAFTMLFWLGWGFADGSWW